MVPGVSWALSDGTVKGTEFPACSVCPSLTHHHHRPRPPTMVARVLSAVITGGRAPSRVPAPLPLSHQPSVRWTFCCYLFSLSWLCLFTAPPRRPRSIHRSQHRTTATLPQEEADLVRGWQAWERSGKEMFEDSFRILCFWIFFFFF